MVDFNECLCDGIREILQNITLFENKEKIEKNYYLFSLEYCDKIDEKIKMVLNEMIKEICESEIISIKLFCIILKINSVYLKIDYGLNEFENDKILCDFYYSLSSNKITTM